ncbi:unnamed protein product [Durusdinium trenchii]|uniref:Uncharacterized protein n=1 Tax=Durusdinium trenchii TaxID=1381693 RepID=A0ABP0QHU6_9DINO
MASWIITDLKRRKSRPGSLPTGVMFVLPVIPYWSPKSHASPKSNNGVAPAAWWLLRLLGGLVRETLLWPSAKPRTHLWSAWERIVRVASKTSRDVVDGVFLASEIGRFLSLKGQAVMKYQPMRDYQENYD